MINRLIQRLTPFDNARGYLRGLAVSAAAVFFLTFSGAFGSGEAPFGRRLAYWVVMIGLGFLWGSTVSRVLFQTWKPSANVWINAMIAAVVMAVPYTAVVWGGSGLFFGTRFHPGALPILFGSVITISMAITFIITLLETQAGAETHASATPPKFLERLPLKLRGAEVWAVEAEDHYLRLHTSKGQDLILMRLADAVAELEGIEGAQVHRSWWVARDAITEAKRGDGRATLKLKDGVEVPVSRTYAGVLRERGWI